MLALTQCWYTRLHQPMGKRHREADGSLTSHCRHCERTIISWGRNRWFLADGFNVTRLAETTGTRFLYLIDTADDFILARFPVGHLGHEAAIEAYRDELRMEYLAGDAGNGIELRDSIRDR